MSENQVTSHLAAPDGQARDCEERMRAEFRAWYLNDVTNNAVWRPTKERLFEAWQAASKGREELLSALSELLDSHTARFPFAKEGAEAQQEWAERKSVAIESARSLLTKYREGEKDAR